MNICLVWPPLMDDNYFVTPPLGLLTVGAALEQAGHRVTVIDLILELQQGKLPRTAEIYDRCAQMVAESRPDIVGISTQCATYPPSLNIARRVRRLLPQAFIVFGGHNASFIDRETLERFPWVDAVVRGEGEVTAVELVERLAQGGDLAGLAGLTYRGRDGAVRNPDRDLIQDLDSLPRPAYHLVPSFKEYGAAGLMATALLDSGRGCSFNCVFCSNCLLWRRQVRYRSVRSIVDELEWLTRDLGADEVYLVHDFFTSDRGMVEDFCGEIERRGLEVEWHCRCRIGGMDIDLLRRMRRTGCTRLLYGVESGSPRTLGFIRKKVPLEDLYGVIRDTVEAGIRPSLSFVVGFPSETAEDVSLTMELALRCQMLGRGFAFIQMLCPLPGTDVAARYLDRLVMASRNAFSQGLEWNGRERLPEDEELIREHPDVFSSFYNIASDNLPLSAFRDVTAAFCPLTQVFPFAYFGLMKHARQSALELWHDFTAWLADQGSPPVSDLPRGPLWHSFEAFAAARLERSSAAHLSDLLRYEGLLARLAEADPTGVCLKPLEAPGPVPKRHGPAVAPDRAASAPGRPELYRRSPRVLVEEFSHDVPAMIARMQAGEVGMPDRTPTHLVVSLREVSLGAWDLQVRRASPFVRALLDACASPVSRGRLLDLASAWVPGAAPGEVGEAVDRALAELLRLGYLEAEPEGGPAEAGGGTTTAGD